MRNRVATGLALAVLAFTVVLAVEGDVVFDREGEESSTPPAVFPHWSHRIRYKCYACHSTLFEMKRGANPTSMEAIAEGRSCGACHNDKIAWGVSFNTCTRCHVEQ
jgi:c(7)-type cytochrome triheme protein